MRYRRTNGFALIILIAMLSLTTLSFVHIASGCRQMFVQTDRLYIRAIQRNLIASGLAWAKARGPVDGRTIMDVNQIAGPNGWMELVPGPGSDVGRTVRIHLYISRQGQVLERTTAFSVNRP